MKAKTHLYLDSKRKKIVPAGNKEAVFFWKYQGEFINDIEAEKFGYGDIPKPEDAVMEVEEIEHPELPNPVITADVIDNLQSRPQAPLRRRGRPPKGG